jgi:hypothetical protein
MDKKELKEKEMVENRAEEYFLSDLLFNNDNQIVLLIKPRQYDTMLKEIKQK